MQSNWLNNNVMNYQTTCTSIEPTVNYGIIEVLSSVRNTAVAVLLIHTVCIYTTGNLNPSSMCSIL